MKSAIITGGSRGIGREICISLANEGYNVLINYSGNEIKANEVAEACRQKNVSVTTFCADVSKENEVEKMFEKAVQDFGKVDVLVNNAGITKDNLILRMTSKDFDDVISINLKGAFNTSKYAAKIMTKQRSGKIINISSIAGVIGNAGQSNYAASKAGLIGLTKTLARELATRGICVNAVAPGFIETDMTQALSENIKQKAIETIPLNRMGKPEEIAHAVLYLVNAHYVTGQVLIVDGGMSTTTA